MSLPILLSLVACDTTLFETGETGGAADTGLLGIAEPKTVGTPTWPIDGVSAANCYHYPGSPYHAPSRGYGTGSYDADDTYALDLNCSGGSESGRAVHPIRAGTVRHVYAGSNGAAGATSAVLVEHPESITIDGITYSSFYTAYLHMQTSVAEGTAVTTSSTLGTVDDYGAASDHLHFAAYVGLWESTNATGRASKYDWSRLFSFDPSDLGGDFASYSYGSYVWRRFVDNTVSSGSYVFNATGTSADLFTSTSPTYGLHGTTAYTTTRTGSTNDNVFEWKFNVLTPATRNYYLWPYIPAAYASATGSARYYVLSGTSTSTSAQSAETNFTVVQNSYYNEYAMPVRESIASGRYVTVRVGDATGSSRQQLAGDQMLLWWKADHCLSASSCTRAIVGSNYAYCYKTDYENATDNCTASSSLPANF